MSKLKDTVKIPLKQLIKVEHSSICDRFYHPAFQRKVDNNIVCVSDISLEEKMVELEYQDGCRHWFDFEVLFGKVICQAPAIAILHEHRGLEGVHFCEVRLIKEKRTKYLRLIFECDLPF